MVQKIVSQYHPQNSVNNIFGTPCSSSLSSKRHHQQNLTSIEYELLVGRRRTRREGGRGAGRWESAWSAWSWWLPWWRSAWSWWVPFWRSLMSSILTISMILMTIMLKTKSMVTFMMVNKMTMVIDHGFQSDYQLDDEHDDDFMLKPCRWNKRWKTTTGRGSPWIRSKTGRKKKPVWKFCQNRLNRISHLGDIWNPLSK